MSERLTEHNETGYVLKLDNPQNEIEARQQLMQKFKLACTKLGQLEDLFEKFDIKELESYVKKLIEDAKIWEKACELACIEMQGGPPIPWSKYEGVLIYNIGVLYNRAKKEIQNEKR